MAIIISIQRWPWGNNKVTMTWRGHDDLDDLARSRWPWQPSEVKMTLTTWRGYDDLDDLARSRQWGHEVHARVGGGDLRQEVDLRRGRAGESSYQYMKRLTARSHRVMVVPYWRCTAALGWNKRSTRRRRRSSSWPDHTPAQTCHSWQDLYFQIRKINQFIKIDRRYYKSVDDDK